MPLQASTIKNNLFSIQGLSSLTFEDENILRAAFVEDFIQYSKSFLYLLRASHGEDGSIGYKFIDKELKAVIGNRKKTIYITPINDTTHGQRLQQLCDEIFHKTGYRVLIKKFSKKTYPKLTKYIKSIRLTNKLEDDACPETLIKLSKLFVTPEGTVNRKAKRFFRKVKRFKKIPMHLEMEIINDLSLVSQGKIEDFLKRDPKKYISYHPIIIYLYKHLNDDRYSVTVFLHKGVVQAIYVVEHFSASEAGLYCGVTAKDQPGITEWMDYLVFQNMFFEGIRTVYLGGSENKGINYFVKKLLPESPPYEVKTVEYNYAFKNSKKIN
jgi:hypothetical protein